jgi:hypothetical protein
MFRQMAQDIVTDKPGAAELPDERKTRIGLFLAAHLAITNSPQMASERVGPYSYTR